MKKRFIFLNFVFLLVIIFLWRGLSLHPSEVPSPLINKTIPAFELPTLHYPSKLISNKDFIGHITLLNVWATWCVACAEEHRFLLELAKNEYLTIYGLDYKDNALDALKWLKENGNPYKMVAFDKDGEVAIDWGVYGTPETFLVDKKGIIRYKQIGPITPEVWEQNLKPIVQQIRNEIA